MAIEEKVHQLATHYPNANARLGIPHLHAGEALHGIQADKATSFPQAIAIGSTWDTDLIERIANIIAKESRAVGIHHVYSPMLGVVRLFRGYPGRNDNQFLINNGGISNESKKYMQHAHCKHDNSYNGRFVSPGI